MSYAASYALYNYYLVDPEKGHDDYSNLRLIRAFENGLDPKSSEAGFILTHIHMVAQTGKLIEGAAGVVEAIETARDKPNGEHIISEVKKSLHSILQAMTIIEANMEKMWTNSMPKHYMSYRTFIYGITNQSMFPSGVIYAGQYDNKPQFFRGESGANDSIIPLLDHVCEIPMPENPLTKILREFREYRPKPHREFLTAIREKAAQVGVRDFLTHAGDLSLTVLYLRVLDHVRSFRWRHWQFTREYIIKRTSHPVATGGSPIITWLPNQLSAVMELMEDVCKGSGLWAVLAEGVWNGGGAGAASSSLTKKEFELIKHIMDNAVDQKTKLAKEVAKYCQDRGVDATKV
jgi:indoleamine 2,3-dioxygenase